MNNRDLNEGFYIVYGISFYVGNAKLEDGQPAFWNGYQWYVIGWDDPIEDNPYITVGSSIYSVYHSPNLYAPQKGIK